MTHRPRHLRLHERGRRAFEHARLSGKSAMDCALAEIALIMNRADRINRLKLRVEFVLRRGPASEDVRCWYSMLTSMLRRANVRTIDHAVQIIVAEMIRTAIIERELGARRLLILRETLDEAVLVLRWLRRYRPETDICVMIEEMARGPEHRPHVHFVAAL